MHEEPPHSPHTIVRFDNEVTSSILEIIRSARRFVVLVSPYVEPIPHVEQELRLAIQRGVKVLVAVRDDGSGRLGGKSGTDAIGWLKALKVDLRSVQRLHSKVYLNESAAVISSMNLLASSWSGSHEMAAVLPKGPEYDSVSDYVFNRVLKLGHAVKTDHKPSRQQQENPGTVRGVGTISKMFRKALELGTCIRCSRTIARDNYRPLCDSCYSEWAQWGNTDFKEKYCHGCGETRTTSYDRPLCRSCYYAK